MGLPLVILSTALTVFIFVDSPEEWVSWVLKFLSVLSALLATVYTFFRPIEKSEQHRSKAVKYGNLKRKLELFCMGEHNPEEIAAFLNSFHEQWNIVADESPTTPEKLGVRLKK